MMQKSRILFFILVVGGLVVGVGRAGGSQTAPTAPASATYNGGWEEVGVGSASGGGISHNSPANWSNWNAVAVAHDGTPYVAWYYWSNGAREILIRRWNGSSWAEVGSGSASGGGISDNGATSIMPSIAFALNGFPIVAWEDGSNDDENNEIYVRQWDGAAWVELGGSASGGGVSSTPGYSSRPALATAADGKPIVAWQEWVTENSTEIYVRQWNGTAWVEMGPGSASGGGVSQSDGNWSGDPSLIVTAAGTPILAWDESPYIYLLRWNGAAWVEMGGSASAGGVSTLGSSWNNSLSVGPDGNPVVAWQYHGDGSPQKIYVRRWNGSDWVQLGGSGTGAGIGSGWDPSVAVAPNGSPLVAWSTEGNGDSEIYALRWNGSAWTEFSTGSTTVGGISNNDESSSFPNLAFAPDGRAFVAWDDSSNGDSEIYVLRSPLIPAPCYPLTSSHSGNGSDPAASPTNSTGCTAGHFTAGQAISLTASPAAGWRVAGWDGTTTDGSTATTNSLTMPAADHTVSVYYESIPGVMHHLFTPAILHQPLLCWPGPNEQEPNDTQTEANGPLCNDRVYTGLPRDNFDVFYFDMPAAGPIAIELDDFAAGEGQLGLLSAAFAPIAYDVNPADGFHISRANEAAGRYYVVVHTAAPEAGSTAHYSLRATFATR